MTGAPPREPGTGDAEPADEATESVADRDARLQALLSVRVAGERDEAEAAAARRRRAPGAPGTDAPPPLPPTPAGTGRRPGVGTVLAVVALLALFASGTGLVYAGTRIIRSSTQGDVLVERTDPAAPGYEALVSPTPTLLVVHDVAGAVESLTVLTLPDANAGGGGVVLVPTRTVSDMPIFGRAPIESAYDLGSADVQAEVVGDVLTAAIGEVVVVDADRWAGLVAPVAPLVVDNPDALVVDGELRFPAGELELDAADVGDFLAARAEGESDLARLFRHELFWQSWLAAVAEAGTADAVPGELEVGIGRFVRALAAGRTVVETLPVDATTLEGFDDEPTYEAEAPAVAALVTELVPFPRSPRPGVRERVRVLNGTSDLDAARALAPALPAVGVEVVIVGNGRDLAQERTTVAYVNPDHEAAASAIGELLGVGEVVVDPRPSDVADITVTLGADHD